MLKEMDIYKRTDFTTCNANNKWN